MVVATAVMPTALMSIAVMAVPAVATPAVATALLLLPGRVGLRLRRGSWRVAARSPATTGRLVPGRDEAGRCGIGRALVG